MHLYLIVLSGAVRARKLNILTLKDKELVPYPLELEPIAKTPYFQKVKRSNYPRQIMNNILPARRILHFRSIEKSNGPVYGAAHVTRVYVAEANGLTGELVV